MPCTPLLPLPHGVVARLQYRHSPGPSPSLSTPVSWQLAGAATPELTHGEAERIASAIGLHSLRRTSPTYLRAHASLSLASPHNGRTDHAAPGPYGSRRSWPRRRTRAGQRITDVANEPEPVQAEASGELHQPLNCLIAPDHRPKPTTAIKFTPATSARLGHPRLAYKRGPRAPPASPFASTTTHSSS